MPCYQPISCAHSARRGEDDGCQIVEAAVTRRALSTRSSMGRTHVGAVSPSKPTSNTTVRRAEAPTISLPHPILLERRFQYFRREHWRTVRYARIGRSLLERADGLDVTTPRALELFQYFLRATPEDSALRANRPRFIGSGGAGFCFCGGHLRAFGLLIMNPLL
jgi:hypothetical protein